MNRTRPFGFQLQLAARRLERHMADALQPLGITPAYLPVLLVLAESEPQRQADLAATLDLRQPTLAQTLARMERDQLITRSPDPTDRRSALIHLTPHAKTLIGHVITIGRDVGQWALQDFTDAQREALLDHFATLNDRLVTAREEP